jgi:hypothetical protein
MTNASAMCDFCGHDDDTIIIVIIVIVVKATAAGGVDPASR